METFEVLEKALALIEREEDWCGEGLRGPTGNLCAVGALHTAVEGTMRIGVAWQPETLKAHAALRASLPVTTSVPHFNDTHSHAEVVALFQTAIREEKRRAGIPIEVPAEDNTGQREKATV